MSLIVLKRDYLFDIRNSLSKAQRRIDQLTEWNSEGSNEEIILTELTNARDELIKLIGKFSGSA